MTFMGPDISIDLFLAVFVSLFVLVDPFGTAAVFTTLTQRDDAAAQRRIAIRASVLAVLILLCFGVFGKILLHYMGISLPAFRIAGGLLLFVTAFRMVLGFHDPDQLQSARSIYKDNSNLAVFPLAIPLLAGPGCMTAVVMFMTKARGLADYGVIFGAVVAVEVLALLILLGSARIGRFIGSTGNGLLARVMGILLCAMAVQFIADGIGALAAGIGAS